MSRFGSWLRDLSVEDIGKELRAPRILASGQRIERLRADVDDRAVPNDVDQLVGSFRLLAILERADDARADVVRIGRVVQLDQITDRHVRPHQTRDRGGAKLTWLALVLRQVEHPLIVLLATDACDRVDDSFFYAIVVRG